MEAPSHVCEAGPYFIFLFSFCKSLHTAYRFTDCCKVKIITVKVSVSVQHCHYVFVCWVQNYIFFLNYANNLTEIFYFDVKYVTLHPLWRKRLLPY